jgi:patatin-like phospholipase/acyl hydrolase
MTAISRREILTLAGAAVAGVTAGAAAAWHPDSPTARGPKDRYLILCCDGGGIRGLLTARVVQRLQQELAREKDKGAPIDFCQRVDLFAGTSTGGIIALGLAAGLPPDKLVALYQDEGPHIFQPYKADDLGLVERTYYSAATAGIEKLDQALAKVPLSPVPAGWSKNSDQLFFAQYDSAALRQALEKVLGKETTLGQLAPKRSALVTSLHLGKADEPWRPVLLHNLPTEDADARLGREMTVLDAALCTSAAPVYFAPHRVAKVGYFADGGVFANNPGVAAVTTALRAGRPLDGIRLLSVGTGSVASYMRVPPWEHVSDKAGGSRCGLLAWLLPRAHDGVPATPLLAAMFDAGAAADELDCRGLVRGGYGRIQVRLEKDVALDDVSAVPRLVEQADAYFESKQWKDVDRKWLLETYLA